MEKNYYIELIGKDFNRKWHYGGLENRNNIYEDVRKRFEKETTDQIPFIEVNKGSEKQSAVSVTLPLRLSPGTKDEVIKYIESLS